MPKATADFRAVRAVLSAPDPLPNIITRSAPSPSPEPIPAPLPVGPPPATDAQPIDAAYHGFPIFNARWRELPPAIPPIPYPTGAGGKKRRWRVKLNRVSKKEGESSEIELRSVVEGGPSRELEITRRMSEVSLGQFAEVRPSDS